MRQSGNSSGNGPSAKSKVLRPSADEVRGDSATFENFMRRLVQVPHSEIKAALEAEREISRRSKAFLFPRFWRAAQAGKLERRFSPPCRSVLHRSISSLRSATLPA